MNPLRYWNRRAIATALQSTGSQGFTRTTDLPPITSFTAMLWSRMDVELEGISTFFKFGATNGPGGYRIGSNPPGTQVFLKSEGHTSVGGSVLVLGRWYHKTIVVDGSGARLYLDGELDASIGVTTSGAEEMCVAWWGEAAGENSYAARCAFKVWDVPLSVPEIQWEMRQIAPVREANLRIFSPWHTLNELTRDYASTPQWVITGDLSETIGPPSLPWVVNKRRRYVFHTSVAGSTTLTVSPAQMQWQAQACTLTRALPVLPAQMQWATQSLQVHVSTQAIPARMQWQAQTVGARTVSAQPSRMQWQAQTPVLTLTLQGIPARHQWAASSVPVTSGVLRIAPAAMAWQAQTPVLTETSPTALILIPARTLMTPRVRLPFAEVVDRNHALNQGLLAWYLAQPWMIPGNKFYDVVGEYHGTVTGVESFWGPSGVMPTTRPLARAELRLEGGDAGLRLRDVPFPSGLFTLAIWVYPYPFDQQLSARLIIDDTTRGLRLSQDTATYYDAVDSPPNHYATATLAALTWTHIIMTTSATGVQFYFNGEDAGSVTYNTGGPAAPTMRWIGNDDLGNNYGGLLDDVRFYARALTAAEARELYARSRMGNQGLLRVPTRILGVGSIVQVASDEEIAVVPARMQWQANTVSSSLSLAVSPTQMQWQAVAPTLSGPATILPRSVIFTRGRRLIQPRLRLRSVVAANESHPLSQGLVAWYLAQPWMFQGNRWEEIVNGYEGVVIDSAAGTVQSGWGSTIRPGGRGEMRFDGVNDAVRLPPISMNGNLFTIALWVHPTIHRGTEEYGGLVVDTNDRGLYYAYDSITYYEFGGHNALTPLPIETWTHIVLVSTGTAVTHYFNGIFRRTIEYSVGAATWNWIGNDENNVAFQGYLDDIRLYNRPLASTEVEALYVDSITGSPTTLQYPKKLWMIGGIPGVLRIAPAKMQWQAQAVRFPLVKLVPPAQMQWRTQVVTATRVIPPVTTITTSIRRLVQPRVRYTPIVGLNQQQARRQKLVLWYMAQPWQYAGHQWVDMAQGKVGDFLNMPATDALAGWKPTTHPGGRGSMGFDGTGRAVVLPPDPDHSELTQLTLSAWMYPRSFGVTGRARILDKMGIAGLSGFYLGVNTVDTTSRAVEFAVGGLDLLIAFSPQNSIDLETWTHVAVVWTGSFQRADVQIYLNGIEVGVQTGAMGQDGEAPQTLDILNPLYIGNRDALDRGFDGLLDDLRLYARALVPAEVRDLYSDSLSGAFKLLQRPRFPMMMGGVTFTEPPIVQTIVPAQMRWYAQTPRIDRRVLVAPAQMQWAVQSLLLTRTATVQSAQMQWQAQPVAMTQIVRVAPSQMQWAVQTPMFQSQVALTPARMQWEAQAPELATRVTLAPVQMQWQAQTPGVMRTLMTLPSRMRWAVQATEQEGVTRLLPAQMQWQAQPVGITQTLLAVSAQMQWQTQNVETRTVLLLPPAFMQWQAQTAALTQSILVAPTQMQWRVHAPGVSLGISAVSARMQWQTHALTIARTVGVVPAQMQWAAQPVVTLAALALAPARMQWQAQSIVATRTVLVVQAQMQWLAGTIFRGSVRVEPAQMQWQVQAPVLPTPLVVTPAQMQWQAQPVGMATGIVGLPAFFAWRAQVVVIARTMQAQGAVVAWTSQPVAITRALLLSPAQMRWQAQAPLMTRVLTVLQAQMQWQAGTQSVVTHIVVTPARMKWQPSTLEMTRTVVVQPGRVQWAPQEVGQAGVVRVTPPMMVWRPETVTITRLQAVIPVQMSWQVSAQPVVPGLLVSEGRMRWQAQDRTLTRGLLLSHAQLQWQTQPLFLGRVVTTTPAQIQWQTQGLALGRVLTVVAAQVQWKAQGTSPGRVVLTTVTQMQWQTQTAAVARTVSVVASMMAWQSQAVLLTRILAAQTSFMQWQAQPAALSRVIGVVGAQSQWQVQAPQITRTVRVSPSQVVWVPQVSEGVPNLAIHATRMQWQTSAQRLPRVVLPAPSQMQWQAGTGIARGPDTLILLPARVRWSAPAGIAVRGNPPSPTFSLPAIPLVVRSHGDEIELVL